METMGAYSALRVLHTKHEGVLNELMEAQMREEESEERWAQREDSITVVSREREAALQEAIAARCSCQEELEAHKEILRGVRLEVEALVQEKEGWELERECLDKKGVYMDEMLAARARATEVRSKLNSNSPEKVVIHVWFSP